jgi:hypothetical protein
LRSTRYLEDARNIFSNNKNKNYYGVLIFLGENYWDLYNQTNDIEYKKRFMVIANEFQENPSKIASTGFRVYQALRTIKRITDQMINSRR